MLQQIIDGYILHYVNTNGDHVSAVCFEYSVDLVATDPDWLDISDSYMERLNLKRYRTEESYDAAGRKYWVGVYCVNEQA